MNCMSKQHKFQKGAKIKCKSASRQISQKKIKIIVKSKTQNYNNKKPSDHIRYIS